MGCKSTACVVCGAHVPACQLINGKCGACRTKEAQPKVVQNTPTPPAPPREKLLRH
jgi:hypothetical protein